MSAANLGAHPPSALASLTLLPRTGDRVVAAAGFRQVAAVDQTPERLVDRDSRGSVVAEELDQAVVKLCRSKRLREVSTVLEDRRGDGSRAHASGGGPRTGL